MNCQFLFKNIKVSREIMEYTEDKIKKICGRFSNNIQKVYISFELEGFKYIVNCSIVGGKNFTYQITAKASDTHTSTDIMLHKLQHIMHKKKDKLIHRHKNHKSKKMHFSDYVFGSEIEKDWEMLPLDAEDIIKFERAKLKRSA